MMKIKNIIEYLYGWKRAYFNINLKDYYIKHRNNGLLFNIF